MLPTSLSLMYTIFMSKQLLFYIYSSCLEFPQHRWFLLEFPVRLGERALHSEQKDNLSYCSLFQTLLIYIFDFLLVLPSSVPPKSQNLAWATELQRWSLSKRTAEKRGMSWQSRFSKKWMQHVQIIICLISFCMNNRK